MDALVESCPQNSCPLDPVKGTSSGSKVSVDGTRVRASWTGVGPALVTGPSREEREAETQRRDACGGHVKTEAEVGVTRPEPRRAPRRGPLEGTSPLPPRFGVLTCRPQGDVASVNRPVRDTSSRRFGETDHSSIPSAELPPAW